MPSADRIREQIQVYIEAMCESDIDGIAALYAENSTVEDPVGGDPIAGLEAIRAFYGATAPNIKVELTGSIRVAGSECAAPILAELTIGENKRYIDVIDVMRFDEAGKITSMRAFWNPAELRDSR
jgi:steroid delta-isomerase